MIYAIYRIFRDESNKGYYWGKYDDPIKLAYACFNLAKLTDDIKIIAYNNMDEIKTEIELGDSI